ncbi:uncharacterized protein RSE6_07453 [Rhynchosporium secalis]|uniref:Pal1 cell morphology n=1 Tax=Rhynchosporium secalis TaxID=38038 RepID=A0A1E1MCV8_RHYSE|nr:uncharacterized protein RSE6_07453 [Rhynchosporium secalis]
MESPGDKNWATKYLIDPLNAPEPSEETGPGTHFTSTMNRSSSTSKSPAFGRSSKQPSVSTYPTPPQSASPTRSSFHPSNPYSPSHRQVAFGDSHEAGPSSRKSSGEQSSKGKGHSRRRGSSLDERFPGDMSHRPLDQLRKESKAANRSPHLRKKHIPGADSIDKLDKSVIGGLYHHEGPYDATLQSRNMNPKYAPVEAVKGTNEEAIRATPREYIRDSLIKHVPLQGTAVIPPGFEDFSGKRMDYEEGADLMREPDAAGGAYKRWDHVKYLPEDLKGKGEPSYSIEKALKEHKAESARNGLSPDARSYEMQPQRPGAGRQRSVSGNHEDFRAYSRPSASAFQAVDGGGDQMQRSNTTGKRIGEGLKKRFGSLRRNKDTAES